MRSIYIPIFTSLLAFACTTTRPPITNAQQALILSAAPQLRDDFGLASLTAGIQAQIQALDKRPNMIMTFGERRISSTDYSLALQYVLAKLQARETRTDILSAIKADFDFYLIYGGAVEGETLVTSYFQPEIEGSLKRTKIFSEPLYSLPEDIVEIELREFDRCVGCPSRLLGRVEQKGGKTKVIPYYSRAEIAKKKPLPTELILCWVKPVDAFFLQVQGSGTILLDKGDKLRLGYHGQNGHQYVAIGKFLTEHAQELGSPLNSLHSIEYILNSLPLEKMQGYLNQNPSYVFFREIDSRPITSFGTEVCDGRTIAADGRYFPKGALAFLHFEEPVFKDPQQLIPERWQATSRFVLDQDSGGAIKGTAHIDLFAGKGEAAKQYAGVMKSTGKLWYLVPSERLLASLKAKA